MKDIFEKIDAGVVTLDDFNQLISEATPESLRDRVRRPTMPQNPAVRSHQDDEGHSDLRLPKFAGRVAPKREREGRTQMHGRGRLGHKQSARTQKRTMSKSLREDLSPRLRKALHYIQENYGKPLGSCDGCDRIALVAIAEKLMAKPLVDRHWLQEVIKMAKSGA